MNPKVLPIAIFLIMSDGLSSEITPSNNPKAPPDNIVSLNVPPGIIHGNVASSRSFFSSGLAFFITLAPKSGFPFIPVI